MTARPQPPPPARLLARELAEYFRVDVRTIRRWVKAGILAPPLRLGNRSSWPREVVDDVLARRA